MNKFLLAIIFLFTLYVNSLSQSRSIDSLKIELKKPQDNIKLINLYLDLSKEYLDLNTDSSKYYISLAQELSESNNFKLGNGRSLLLLGNIETRKGYYSVAFDFMLKALRIFEEENNNYYRTICLINLGENSRASGFYQNAIKYLSEAEKLAISSKDKPLLNRVYNRLAAVYYEMLAFENADAGICKNYCQKSLDLSNELNDSVSLSNNYNILGMVYYSEKYFKEAEKFVGKAIEISERLKLTDLSNYLINLAVIKYDTFDFEESLNLAQKAYELSISSGIRVYLMRSSYMLMTIYEAKGDYKNAFYYYKISVTASDSLYAAKTIAKIEEITSNYNLEKKEKELSTAKLYTYVTISFAVIIIIISLSLFLILKKSKKHNSELKELNIVLNEQNEKISAYAEQLASANVDKDKFFSIIAHDLRTPFNPILGFAEILSRDFDDYSEQERKQMADLILLSSKNLMNLLDNLLQWSKVRLKKIKIIKKDFYLDDVVKENLRLLNHNIIQKELNVLNNVSEKCTVRGDKEMISFIIRNFISNAIKFTDRKGNIKIYNEIKNNCIKLSVEDNGIGIPEANLKNIFGINNFVKTSGTEGEQGTGLGLLISKEFISFNEGELFVDSVENSGSKFSFTVPLVVHH